jgi:hypothetical protein
MGDEAAESRMAADQSRCRGSGGFAVSGSVFFVCVAAVLCGMAIAAVSLQSVRRRGLDRWIFTYMRERPKRRNQEAGESVHVLLCIADHFEPGNGGATKAQARERMQRWVEDYPRLCEEFRDSDGRPPRHTFFYPIEQYVEDDLDALARMSRLGLGEVEIHLHHDRDTPEELRRTLLHFKQLLAERHGLLARSRETGELAYAFVHGDWALDNSRPDGKCCGVNNEIEILRQTGCYADFTLPSVPSPTQTRKINSIYYAVDDPRRPRSHDWGTDVGGGAAPRDGLMMIQGPLVLNRRRRKWGILPRIENACIQGNQPPSLDRLDNWLRARVQIPTRPDWYFVKLHTHGAPESNADVLLGEPMVRFHQELARRSRQDPNFQFHYVTAREMYNLVRAAEAGWQGTIADARDYELIFNGATGKVLYCGPNYEFWSV